jgi:DNA-binding beta-propeller fold protein YncE
MQARSKNKESSGTIAFYRSNPIYVISFVAAVFLLFFTYIANAQGSLVRHFVTLDEDVDGMPLGRPSFAQYDKYTDEIYVIDATNKVLIYTSDLFPILSIGESRNISVPTGLAVAPDGTLYVGQGRTNFSRERVSVFDPCLKWKRDIFFEGFDGADDFSPHRLALDNKGNLYVVGFDFPGVLVYDSDYNLVDIMTHEEDGKKVGFVNLTIDDKGWIYLVCEEKGHIYVYDSNMEFIYQFGEKGGGVGKLSRPKAVGVDNARGWVYVVDYMRHTVNTYDKNGNIIFEFGGMGWGEGWFRFPSDISVNRDGDVMISDIFNHRVQIFKPY